jgi:SOS response regulatory protein OraA/RecX
MGSVEHRRRGQMPQPAGSRVLALRWLARRPLAQAEIRKRLAGKGFGVDEIELTISELVAKRLLDDEALALDFIVLRSARMRLGKRRLLRELERRGIDAGVAERAYLQAVESGDLDPEGQLRAAVAARLKRERDLTTAGLRRVYNALLRAGFPATGLYAELKRQRDARELAEHGYHDESP